MSFMNQGLVILCGSKDSASSVVRWHVSWSLFILQRGSLCKDGSDVTAAK